MATQALASNNPGPTSSAIWKEEEPLQLVLRLDLSHREALDFFRWVQSCTDAWGSRIYLCRSVKVGAIACGVCETTMRKRIRRYEGLGLVIHEPASWYRTNLHVVNIPRLRQRDWPDGICPRCKHKHIGRAECGCALGERVWRRSGQRERQVERVCRCVPREILPPKRRGPQRVASRSEIASPPPAPVPAAAPKPVPPAAAVERGEHQTFRKFGSRAAREARKLRAQLGIRVAQLIEGHTGHVSQADHIWIELSRDHPDYKLPMARDQALRAACKELTLTEDEGRELLQYWNPEEAFE